jgi:hypothetical protein
MARKPPLSIQVTGLRRVRSNLRKIDTSLPKELRQANLAAAKLVAEDSERFAPERTGRLARSVGARASTTSASVKAGTGVRVPYAGPIHFGWKSRGIAAQEFIYKAIVVNKKKITKLYSKSLDDVIKRAGLNRRF